MVDMNFLVHSTDKGLISYRSSGNSCVCTVTSSSLQNLIEEDECQCQNDMDLAK